MLFRSRSMGRKGVWGGREPGAEGSMGRKGVWGGRESGADGSLGRKGAWGGWEPGAEAADEPASRGAFGQCIHVDTEQLTSAAPSHSTSADKHPRMPRRAHVANARTHSVAHTRALPMTQAHAHYRSSTLTLKLRHFSARREASTLFRVYFFSRSSRLDDVVVGKGPPADSLQYKIHPKQ